MRHFNPALFLTIAMLGCTTLPASPKPTQAAVAGPAPASSAVKLAPTLTRAGDPEQGQAFAQTYCSGCHDVTGKSLSPDPRAPSFAAVANSRGLTGESLTTWLRDSHNYPDVMTFEIQPENIGDLATYMLELKDPDYEPPIG